MLCLRVQMLLLRDSFDPGGIGWLAAGGIPKSLDLLSALLCFSGICACVCVYFPSTFFLRCVP